MACSVGGPRRTLRSMKATCKRGHDVWRVTLWYPFEQTLRGVLLCRLEFVDDVALIKQTASVSYLYVILFICHGHGTSSYSPSLLSQGFSYSLLSVLPSSKAPCASVNCTKDASAPPLAAASPSVTPQRDIHRGMMFHCSWKGTQHTAHYLVTHIEYSLEQMIQMAPCAWSVWQVSVTGFVHYSWPRSLVPL